MWQEYPKLNDVYHKGNNNKVYLKRYNWTANFYDNTNVSMDEYNKTITRLLVLYYWYQHLV